MEVTALHVYNSDVDSVFKTYGTESDLIAKHESLGARNMNITNCELTDSSLELSFSKEMPVDAPGALKKFLGEWNGFDQSESWTGTPGERYEGNLEFKIHGVPAKLTGTCVLTQEGAETHNNVTVKIECGIPLVGKKLAKFLADNCEDSIAQEYEFIKSLVES